MTSAKHAGIVAATGKRSIDPVQLQHLEQSFRTWASAPSGLNRKASRKRVLLVFLLIRYTGARLNEILSLHPVNDIDPQNRCVRFHKGDMKKNGIRQVQIPEVLVDEIKSILNELKPLSATPELFKIDPAHVRRKFYDCAEAAGIARELGTPEAIRRSRAIELMQSNVPLPVVQKIMGHSTPNLAASYVEYSDEEIRKVERFHVERENKRKTSARNSFFGKIDKVHIGDVQAAIEIISIDGQRIYSTVTNDSQSRLGLSPGCLVAVEVKAPWVVLYKGVKEPACSAENRFKGSVQRVLKGKINSEVVVQIS
ncbi:MAG: tyrosine-type recombinase/integrase, partial [Desulfobacterales bacterium]|nr:tyrosine-type recombinase/integrase [Desulfobacterales bacterium]